MARNQIMELLPLLRQCNVPVDDVLAKQVSFLLAGAQAWNMSDSPLLASHIIHTLLIPRIRCKGKDLIEPIKTMQQIEHLSPELQKTLSQLMSKALSNRNGTVYGFIR